MIDDDKSALREFSEESRKLKQKWGNINLDKAITQLTKFNLDLKVITQGVKFEIDGVNYTYWSKKNRVYKGTKDTNLTINKFIKEYLN